MIHKPTINKEKGKPPAVVLLSPKYPHNVGAAIRACAYFGIEQLWWTGTRVDYETSAGRIVRNASRVEHIYHPRRRISSRLPREERMKGYKEVQLFHNEFPLEHFKTGTPICIEIRQGSENLVTFKHPDDAIYIFGPEDGGVPSTIARLSHYFVTIPSHFCLNLAAAVNIVLYDRRMKRMVSGIEPMYPLENILKEHRGPIWSQEET